VSKVDAPILIVHGKDDTTIPVGDAHAIMTNCPESHLSLLEIEGAGHESVDKIEEHSGELLDFLREAGFVQQAS
jgi:alpha-beta hydrolase superfamily lysophospholipase